MWHFGIKRSSHPLYELSISLLKIYQFYSRKKTQTCEKRERQLYFTLFCLDTAHIGQFIVIVIILTVSVIRFFLSY